MRVCLLVTIKHRTSILHDIQLNYFLKQLSIYVCFDRVGALRELINTLKGMGVNCVKHFYQLYLPVEIIKFWHYVPLKNRNFITLTEKYSQTLGRNGNPACKSCSSVDRVFNTQVCQTTLINGIKLDPSLLCI